MKKQMRAVARAVLPEFIKPFIKDKIDLLGHVRRHGYSKGRNLQQLKKHRNSLLPIRPFYPSQINLYITQNCNLRCNHCQYLIQNGSHFSSGTDMTIPRLEGILRVYGAYASSVCVGAEGEPTCHKDFSRILEICGQSGLKVSVPTNGIRAERYIDDFLTFADDIMVSVDGFDSASYQKMRAASERTFQQLLAFLDELKSRRERQAQARLKSVRLNFVVHKEIIHSMAKMIEFAKERGATTARFSNFNPEGPASSWQPLYDDDPEVLHVMNDLRAKKWGIKVTLPKPISKVAVGFCPMLFNCLQVNQNGDLSPCCHVACDSKWGSVDHPQTWNSKAIVEFRASFARAASILELPKQCLNCHRRMSGKVVLS